MLSINGISKTFGAVTALVNVHLTFTGGEVHALSGENGAGKSTLTKIIAGALQPTRGEIVLDGRPVRWASVAHAQRNGIRLIHQELALFPNLSVAENIFIGHERRGPGGLLSHARSERDAAAILTELGAEFDPRTLVGHLSVAQQQIVEIARALSWRSKVLILDEPTGLISGRHVDILFNKLRNLCALGVAVVYISHRIDEILELANRVTVLKDGCVVDTVPRGEITRERLISMMVGRSISQTLSAKRMSAHRGRRILRAEHISVPGRVKDVTFDVYEGEIVGLAGLIGAGRSELAMSIFGALRATEGSVTVDGDPYPLPTPRRSIERGIGLLTEDRKGEGLATNLDVAANVTAAELRAFTHNVMLDRQAETVAGLTAMNEYGIKCSGPEAPVVSLSGGNQQKILLARWARVAKNVLILDEPTRGVDVGAKREIYHIIQRLADAGVAILVISSELPEIVGMADRVIVMRQGTIAGELSGTEITEESIMRLAAHVSPTSNQPANARG